MTSDDLQALLRKLAFAWLDRLFSAGLCHELVEDDLYCCDHAHLRLQAKSHNYMACRIHKILINSIV